MRTADTKEYGTPEYWAAVKADAAAWKAEEDRKFYAAFDEAHRCIDLLKQHADQDREMPREDWHQNMLSAMFRDVTALNKMLARYFEED